MFRRSIATWIFALTVLLTPPAHAAMTDKVVRIGVLNDQSGPYADIGGQGSVEAARMAAEDAGGRIGDAPIEVVAADHQNRADIASSIARRWFDQEGVDVIVDLPFSSAALAVQAIAREKRKVVIYTGAASERLTQEDCAPTTFHFVYDSYSQSHVTGRAAVELGGKTWFFIVSDYIGGIAPAEGMKKIVQEVGAKVVGEVRHPAGSADYSSFLMQAQASGADVIFLTAAGSDMITEIKQASEFGLTDAGQKITTGLMFLSDVDALGLPVAHGMLMATSFYWDYDDATRAWSARYFSRTGKQPNDNQAGVYSGVSHYLKAVKALGSDEPTAVSTWMKQHPVDDFFGRGAPILPNGRLMKEMYLAEIKKPSEARARWDYLKISKVIPGPNAFRPLAETVCPFAQHSSTSPGR